MKLNTFLGALIFLLGSTAFSNNKDFVLTKFYSGPPSPHQRVINCKVTQGKVIQWTTVDGNTVAKEQDIPTQEDVSSLLVEAEKGIRKSYRYQRPKLGAPAVSYEASPFEKGRKIFIYHSDSRGFEWNTSQPAKTLKSRLDSFCSTVLFTSVDTSINLEVADSLLATLVNSTDIRGKFQSFEDYRVKLLIDANYRVKTNITMVNKLTGERALISFPHQLRQDEFTEMYTSRGYVNINVYGSGGFVQSCRYPVLIEITSDKEAKNLDVNLSYPAQVYLDVYGRCYSSGTLRDPFGFVRQ